MNVHFLVGTNGFYTDFPRKPEETVFNSPDRIGLVNVTTEFIVYKH